MPLLKSVAQLMFVSLLSLYSRTGLLMAWMYELIATVSSISSVRRQNIPETTTNILEGIFFWRSSATPFWLWAHFQAVTMSSRIIYEYLSSLIFTILHMTCFHICFLDKEIYSIFPRYWIVERLSLHPCPLADILFDWMKARQVLL